MNKLNTDELDRMTDLLSEIGVVLLSNGANTTRTVRNLKRIAETFNYQIEQFFSHSAIVLTVVEPTQNIKKTVVKTIPHYGVNLSIVSEISILSWEIASHNIPFEQINSELNDIKQMNSYPEWVKFVLIGFATAALSKIFDGNYIEFLVAFLSAFIGIYARKFLNGRKYNIYMSWFFAAFVSTTVVNVFRYFGLQTYQGALTACVLWLIPGVPLINGFLDILRGHIVSGWAKVAMGFMLIFMIGIGFYLSLFLFEYEFTL